MAEQIPDLPDRKLFAGPRVRRLRTRLGLTQSRMAEEIGVSAAYLNLIERNQRPLTAPFLIKLAAAYDLDLRELTAGDEERAERELTEALADPLLAGLDIGRAEVQEAVSAAPGVVQALLRAYRAAVQTPSEISGALHSPPPLEEVRDFIQDRRNHFPELEAACETIADELRLQGADLMAAIADRLRVKHGFSVRILPHEVMPEVLRRLDLHNRQVQLSEVLDPASRRFQLCCQLAMLEMKELVEEAASAAGLGTKPAQRLLAQNLYNYAAAALMMPYVRFHGAAETLGYDLELLQARFGAGFEQVAHRLTTLQRPGARGVPFFLIRVDRAGQVSKRFSPGGFPFSRTGGTCPLWSLNAAFERPRHLHVELIELDDEQRFLSLARGVRTYAQPYGGRAPEFVVALGCEVGHAHGLVYARGLDLDGQATPIGLGCSACSRTGCRQRAVPPAGRRVLVDTSQRGPTPIEFETG